MPGKVVSSPRVAAIVGPYLSGKTSLMESLLHKAGAIPKKGSVKDGNTVGDPSPEARGRQMSVETSIASCTYLGESWTFLDCPGSVEFTQDTLNALMVVDVAVVVCEPDPYRALTISPILKFLDDHSIPHIIFINKVDTHLVKMAEVLEALQSVSERPLLLREIPIRDDDRITGFVDLVSERAYKFVPGRDSDLIKLPENLLPEEHTRRQYLLEALADFPDPEQRRAYFCSVLVLVRHAEDPLPLIADGQWHGEILLAARGEGGFGYDPLFWVPELEQTAAELDAKLKNTLSHRAAAMRHLLARLQSQPL